MTIHYLAPLSCAAVLVTTSVMAHAELNEPGISVWTMSTASRASTSVRTNSPCKAVSTGNIQKGGTPSCRRQKRVNVSVRVADWNWIATVFTAGRSPLTGATPRNSAIMRIPVPNVTTHAAPQRRSAHRVACRVVSDTIRWRIKAE